jgi:hypothetical protein
MDFDEINRDAVDLVRVNAEASRMAAELALEAGRLRFQFGLGDPIIDPPEYDPCICLGAGAQFRLSIDCGEIHILCAKCGRMPAWMEEFGDCASMADILVTIRDANVPGKNCGCNLMEQLSHDCGPEFVISVQKTEMDMQCPDTEPHGPHTWLVEGRIPAACPGR